MNDDKQNFGDDLKKGAEKAAGGIKETTKEFTYEAKQFIESQQSNKKILAGVLAILLGGLGVHKFILGYRKEGFLLLGISLLGYALSCVVIGLFFCWIPGLIALIEGIIYLTKSNEEFYNTYQLNKKPWF